MLFDEIKFSRACKTNHLHHQSRIPTILRSIVTGALIWVGLVISSPSYSQQSVDLELALLVDVSASVNQEEFRLQANGLAAAISSPPVVEALTALSARGVAINVIQWADADHQKVAVDWTLVSGESDALWLASKIVGMPRLINGGHTSLTQALIFAAEQMDNNIYNGARRIIDIVSDGRNNSGRPMRTVRREILEQGIVINGLPITNELPLLYQYFRDHVIGGEQSFYVVAEDYGAFANAMIEKLVREISAAPLTQAPLTPNDSNQTVALNAAGKSPVKVK